MENGQRTDALTRWWRGISLRAKITGVTVGVLALGLLGAGLGTVPFLRSAFVTQIGESLKQQASNEALAEQLFEVVEEDGELRVRASESVLASNAPFAALYGPDGTFIDGTRSTIAVSPQYPDAVRPSVEVNRTEPFALESTDGEAASFLAFTRVVQMPVGGTAEDRLFVIMLVASTDEVDKNIGTYIVIFFTLASVTVLIGAFLTRWVVTLAFRRLGQVESTAMAIAAGNFTQRMPGAEPRTEVGRLKLAINTMLGRLDAALAQRDASVSQMRRFVGDASHELRTPLVTVRGYAELYRMGAIQGEENIAQAMDRIEKEAVRMGNLVEDLLALARLDEKRAVVFSPVDLRPIARDAALDLRATSAERTASYLDTTIDQATVLPADESPFAVSDTQRKQRTGTAAFFAAGAALGRLRRRPKTETAETATAGASEAPLTAVPTVTHPAPAPLLPIVMGEEDRIRQVVANLVGNARRYTPEDSPIEIAVGVDGAGEHGWIAVIDHGEGIPPQQREQIFQRFWRADTSRARETGGSGLGLAIVASIVASMHSTIEVEETPGGGATFRVSVPLALQRAREDHLLIPTQPLERLELDADGNPLPPVF